MVAGGGRLGGGGEKERRGRGEFLHPMLMNRSDMPFKRSPELFFFLFLILFFSHFFKYFFSPPFFFKRSVTMNFKIAVDKNSKCGALGGDKKLTAHCCGQLETCECFPLSASPGRSRRFMIDSNYGSFKGMHTDSAGIMLAMSQRVTKVNIAASIGVIHDALLFFFFSFFFFFRQKCMDSVSIRLDFVKVHDLYRNILYIYCV